MRWVPWYDTVDRNHVDGDAAGGVAAVSSPVSLARP